MSRGIKKVLLVLAVIMVMLPVVTANPVYVSSGDISGIRIFNSEGVAFEASEDVAANIGEGWIINNPKSPILVVTPKGTINLFQDSILITRDLVSNNPSLYLVRGKAIFETSGMDGGTLTVSTPVSIFTLIGDGEMFVVTDDKEESVTIFKGEGTSYNTITRAKRTIGNFKKLEMQEIQAKPIEVSYYLAHATNPDPKVAEQILSEKAPQAPAVEKPVVPAPVQEKVVAAAPAKTVRTPMEYPYGVTEIIKNDDGSEVFDLFIVHTNDLNGNIYTENGGVGVARLSTMATVGRSITDNYLMLNSGSVGEIPTDMAMTAADLIDWIGYDAYTPQAVQLATGITGTKKALPLSVNALDTKDYLVAQPYQVYNFNGFTVGVVGLVAPKPIQGVTFDSDLILENAQYAVDMARSLVDYLVVLGDLGSEGELSSEMVCQNIDGIDLFVDGNGEAMAKTVNGTLIVRADSQLRSIGAVQLQVENGKVSATYPVILPAADILDPMNSAIAASYEPMANAMGYTLMTAVPEDPAVVALIGASPVVKAARPAPVEAFAKAAVPAPVKVAETVAVAEVVAIEPVAEVVAVEPVAEVVAVEPVAEVVAIEPVAEVVTVEPVAEVVVAEPVAEVAEVETVVEEASKLAIPTMAEAEALPADPIRDPNADAIGFETSYTFVFDGTDNDKVLHTLAIKPYFQFKDFYLQLQADVSTEDFSSFNTSLKPPAAGRVNMLSYATQLISELRYGQSSSAFFLTLDDKLYHSPLTEHYFAPQFGESAKLGLYNKIKLGSFSSHIYVDDLYLTNLNLTVPKSQFASFTAEYAKAEGYQFALSLGALVKIDRAPGKISTYPQVSFLFPIGSSEKTKLSWLVSASGYLPIYPNFKLSELIDTSLGSLFPNYQLSTGIALEQGAFSAKLLGSIRKGENRNLMNSELASAFDKANSVFDLLAEAGYAGEHFAANLMVNLPFTSNFTLASVPSVPLATNKADFSQLTLSYKQKGFTISLGIQEVGIGKTLSDIFDGSKDLITLFGGARASSFFSAGYTMGDLTVKAKVSYPASPTEFTTPKVSVSASYKLGMQL